ncbi:uncharacterized protein PIG-Wb [Drosophila virilis]|uniref:Phosphatidylinositol-glycan biosynthesis class W protein n=1 Tax=Drosophila virilis TaxID=7244 RepID=B4MGN4_DROVI|nr:uncharacterized protein At4g17910 [Drosophila virilis]EDW57100.1 uncharacterized protein Dvir_GJ16076 [Drosophila virilis]
MASERVALASYDIPEQHIDKRSWESIEQSFASLCVILANFSGIVLARVLSTRPNPNICYLVEFALIVVPTVLFVTVASSYSVHFVALMMVLLLLYLLRARPLSRAKSRAQFQLGTRPFVLTLMRSMTHLITAICILAIDFASFHRPYRKSRLFGAQLMDTGIGLFVVTMGLVSRRPRNCADLRRSIWRSSLPLILLGIARVVAILIVGYGQDEHEYGRHLNAFFTLGLTKFFGSLFCFLPRNDTHLLPLGLGLLVCHQLALTLGGISEYVMNEDLPRSTFVSANREGLFSLPGFVAIYLLSICLSRWLVSKTSLSYNEIVGKLRSLLIISVLCWLLMAGSAYAVGIARVTCNLGYVSWMMFLITSMLCLSIFIFHLVIDDDNETLGDIESLEKSPLIATGSGNAKDRGDLLVICNSLNMNGLVFFLLANILTGGVNIFLEPEYRSDPASVFILLAYMLVVTSVAHLLYKTGIRIA